MRSLTALVKHCENLICSLDEVFVSVFGFCSNFMSSNLVRHFRVLHFHVLQFHALLLGPTNVTLQDTLTVSVE